MEFAALTKLMQEKEITTQYVQAFIAEDITAYKTLCSLSQTEDCKKKYKESHENIDKLTPIDLATYHYLSNRSDLKNNKIFAELENQLACCIYFEQISKECVTFIENKGQALFLCHAPKTLFAEFHHKDSMRPDTFYIYCLVDHGTPSYKVKAGPFLDKYYRCEQQQNIANTQPKISAPLMVEQFKKRITSNKIQIEGVDGKAMLSETIAFMRSLSIIRVNPFTQVAASIDFMRKHFSKLNQKDIQTYIFINLFQFDLLENQLLSAPNSMFDLLQIIQNGIDLNLQKTQMKEPSVFFLKIAFCVRKVINNIKFRSEYVQTFYARLEQNLSQIIHHFQTKPKTDYLISQLYQLHTYELLNAQFEENNLDFPQLSIPQYQKIIPAIAFRHNFEDLFFIDPFIESQARSAIGCFLRGLNTQDDLSNALYKAVKCLNIPMLTENYLKGNWQQEFPMCRLVSEKDNVEKLAVNLASGQVMIHGHSFGMLPAVVYNHPLFTRFFEGKCHPAIILQDQKCYEFSIQHKNKQTKTYRFSLEREAILQQLIELKGEKLWYQYLSVSPKEVPSLYKQYGTEIWQREKNLVVMDTLSQNVIAFYDNKTQNLYKWLIDGPKKIINHLKAEFLKPYSFITNFEDEKFLEFIESTAAEKALGLVLTIRLPRYNLEFEQRQINHKMEFVWKEDPRYKLNLEYPYQIIPGLKATLVLTSRNLKTTEKDHKEAKDTLKPLILIPKQEFMPHDQSDEEYYFYQLDINNSILRARLEIFLRYSIDELYEDKLYYYNNQEQYLKLQLIGKNQLKVLSNADEFYLAYLYLVRRQPLLSLQVLQKISMSHEGLELDQIKWLIRIITEMPIKLQLLTIQEAYITTPEFVAVRAWVGALLIQYKLSNIPVKFTLNYESTLQRNMQLKPHLRVINRDYQKFIQGGLQELFECDKYLNVKIRACYEAYLATINNIPINMRLPELLELKLLRYLSFVSTELKPKFARPVLEFLAQPHVQYRLNTLKHTRKKLQVLKLQQVRDSLNVQDTKSVDFLNQRIQKIEKSLLAPKTLMSVTTQMLNITVNLRYASPYKDLSHKDKMLLCKNTEKYEANPLKMSDWHLSIDGDDFLYSYFDLLHICITQKHPDREQLKQRIEAFINFIGMRQFEDPKLTYSTFDQLLVILNCAMKHPDKFAQFSRKIYFEQLNSLFNEIINIITKIDNNSGIAITLPVQVDDTGAFLKYVIERNKKLHKAGHSWGITVIIPKPIEAALMPYQKFESVISSKVLTVKPESVDTIESPLVEQQQQVMALFEVSKNKLIVNPVSSVFNSQVNLDVKVSHDISSSSISKQFLDQLSVDYRAGVEQNRLTATLDNTIKNYYENMDKKVLTDFITQISQFLAGEKKIIAELKLKLFSAVNSLPKDMAEAFQYKLTTMGQEFMTIKSLRIIIKLLLTKDFSLLNVHSSFNERSLQSVFELFINLMVHTTHYDLVNRLQIHLVDLNHQVIEKETVLNEICAILKSKRCFNPSEDFESLLFEFMEKKILHGLQYKYIQDLTIRQGLSFKSQSAQLIMGAGKTTVVVPEITKKKALGCNLVVIEVPESLLNLNLIDTNKTTLLVYGKPATPFVFNDGTDCTVAYLRNRLFDFNTIILNKAYLITTKGSLQSFELKFLKVLRFSDIHNPSTATKVRLFTQILKIFRNADVLIDEVDSTLDVRKQLIYSVGKGEPVPAHEISAVLALFDFAKKLDISDLLKIKQATLFDVVLEKISIPPKLWPTILKRFAEALVCNISSPLFSMLNAYLSKDSKADIENNMILVEYLMGTAKTIPPFLSQFSATDLDTIGIYKEQISQILSLTLQKLANENFGLSKDPKKYDIEK